MSTIPLVCWPYLWYAKHVCCMLILFMGKCHEMSNVMKCQMSWNVKCQCLTWSVLVCFGLSWSVLVSVSNTNIYIQLTYSGICGGRIFLPSRCHFFSTLMADYEHFLHCDTCFNSSLWDSGKLSFGPVSSFCIFSHLIALLNLGSRVQILLFLSPADMIHQGNQLKRELECKKW